MQNNLRHDEAAADAYDKRAIAAIFDSLAEAKDAVRDLHDAGFHGTWVGVAAISDAYRYENERTATDDAEPNDRVTETGSENTVRTAEGGGFGASVARFFGEDHQKPLIEALMGRGIPRSDAAALDNLMHDGGAVLTVDVGDDYDLAMQIFRNDGGVFSERDDRTAGAHRSYDVASTTDGASSDLAPRRSVEGETLQLREERLLVDKERVSAGAATLRKRVVSDQQSVDVPVSHDELFISRRPVTREASASGSIGTDETVTIPLMRDQVVVDRRAYVTEEVRYGKRSVDGTERVVDRVSHEELVVDRGDGRDARDR